MSYRRSGHRRRIVHVDGCSAAGRDSEAWPQVAGLDVAEVNRTMRVMRLRWCRTCDPTEGGE